ncbi:MAG: sterol desaturase family protein [Synechocystis sp.]|jgi:sterol desaturase/sphingolipid hydroxylase (fatty acid hydroxylase superfamily)
MSEKLPIVRWRFDCVEQWIATLAFDHWHHTNDNPKYINKNYAAILPWVDKCFGSFYLPKKRWPRKYGINTKVSSNLTGQLFSPLGITKI